MQKKPFITSVRMFMAAGSFVGMVGGWALLAQSDAHAASTAGTTTTTVASAPAQPGGFVTAAPATRTTTATRVTTTTRTTPVLRTKSS